MASGSERRGAPPPASSERGGTPPKQRFSHLIPRKWPAAIRRFVTASSGPGATPPPQSQLSKMAGAMTSDVAHGGQHTVSNATSTSAAQDNTITPHGGQHTVSNATSSSAAQDDTITPHGDQHVVFIGGRSSAPQDRITPLSSVQNQANVPGLRKAFGLFCSSRRRNSGGNNTRNNNTNASTPENPNDSARNDKSHSADINARTIENPNDSAGRKTTEDEMKEMKVELKKYRTVSLALIALVCSVGLYGLSSNIAISEAQKFFSCVALVVMFVLAIITVAVAYSATTDDWHLDIISIASGLQAIYLFDILLLFLYSFAYWNGAKSDHKVEIIMLVCGSVADLIILFIWIAMWRRPKKLYNAPSMKVARCISWALLLAIWCVVEFIFCHFFGFFVALISTLYGVLHKVYELVSQASACTTRYSPEAFDQADKDYSRGANSCRSVFVKGEAY